MTAANEVVILGLKGAGYEYINSESYLSIIPQKFSYANPHI
jgi:hypothetical protein